MVLDSGSSSDAAAKGAGMAVSTVGSNTQIIGNIIGAYNNVLAYINYGIEAFGAGGLQIEDNIITELTGSQYGVFINHFHVPVPPSSPIPGRLNATNVVNNNITGCSTGIESQGDYNVYLNIEGNKVKDFVNSGIFVSTDCLDASVNIANNTIVLTIPNTLAQYYIRIAIGTGTTLTTINGFIRIINNNVNYESTAGGGAGYEGGILTGHAGTLVENNVVNTNNIQIAGPANIYTYWTYNLVVDAVKYLNNKSFGTHATVDLSTFTNTIQIGNNWPNGAKEVLFDIIKTATDAAYAIASAGELVKLPIITAARVVTLPAAASYAGGTIKIWNQNTATFHWTFSGTVKDATNTTITTLTNQAWYILLSDGTNWNKIN